MSSVVTKHNCEALIKNEKSMRYRKFGSTGLEVSALSFGCMRLQDNEELNTELIATAIDLGINYFESTRHYLGGTCQHRVAPGLRGKTAGIIVSGKEGVDANKTEYQFFAEIERQLNILGLTHFKFFQVGWLRWSNIPHLLKPGGVLDALRRAKNQGLIQYVGFTGHDSPENFIKCIETGLFDSITVPYNLINRQYEPTIKRAGELGLGVVAMCPVAGGMLSYDSKKMQEELNMDMPTTEMAIRFVLSNPDVSTCCSGMSTMEMLHQNVQTAFNFDPANAVAHETICEGLDRMIQGTQGKLCTDCRYCMPCPQNVNIPYFMNIQKNIDCFGLEQSAREAINRIAPNQSFTNCNNCGECEKKCPNNLPIRATFEKLSALA